MSSAGNMVSDRWPCSGLWPGMKLPRAVMWICSWSSRSPGFDGYMDLKHHLEECLGCRVDLVTKRAFKPDARPVVEQEAVDVP